MNVSKKIKVSDYYRDELFRLMPEDMFDILDEAYFLKKTEVVIPDNLIVEFNNNKLEK